LWLFPDIFQQFFTQIYLHVFYKSARIAIFVDKCAWVPVVESDGEFLRVAMAAIVKARELLRWTWVYSYYKSTPDLIFDDQQVRAFIQGRDLVQ
jgi:hypothetical protein